MTASTETTDEQTALVATGEALPLAPPAWERVYLDQMTPPHPRGITGWLTWWRRRGNARKLGDGVFDQIQIAFQAGLIARYNLALQQYQGLMEEHNRLQLARARLVAMDLIAREAARQVVARRLQMVRQLMEIRETLVTMGVPEEVVDRRISLYVERLIDALGSELSERGNNGTDE